MSTFLIFLPVMLLILSSGSVLAVALGKLRFEEALPLTPTAIVLVLLVFGVCGRLLWGVYAVCALAVGIYGCSVWLFLRSRESFVSILRRLFTPAALLYGLVFCLLLYISVGMRPHLIDEFIHWADTVIFMFGLDDFATNPLSTALYPAYPPGMALLQYFFVRLLSLLDTSRAFCEWLLYFTYQMFAVSFFFPFFTRLSVRKPIVSLLSVSVVLISPLAFSSGGYTSMYSALYIDPFLAVLFGSALAMIFSGRGGERIRDPFIICACIMLTLAKSSGLLLAVMLLVMYALCLAPRGSGLSLAGRTKRAIPVALAIAIPHLLWRIELISSGVTQRIGGKDPEISLSQLGRIILHQDDSVRQIAYDGFWGKCLSVPLRAFGWDVPCWVLLLLGAVILLVLVRQYLKHDSRNTAVKLFIPSVLVATVVFLVGLCLAYVVFFAEYEALYYAALNRYSTTFYNAVWIAICLMASWLAFEAADRRVLVGLLLFVLLLTPPELELRIGAALRRETAVDSQSAYTMSDALYDNLSSILEDGEVHRLYLVLEESERMGYYQMRCLIRPSLCQSEGQCILSGEDRPYNGLRLISAQDWQRELISDYDYVAIHSANDFFREKYASLFAEDSPIENGGVYSVDKETGLLTRYR